LLPARRTLLLWHVGQSFALKADGGRTTEAQVEMLTRLKNAGVVTAVAHGIDQALACLQEWGLLRGRVS
jgi:hypothetical protein